MQRLEDENADKRAAAVRDLGASAELVAQHGAAIAQRLGDDDSAVRAAAVAALQRYPMSVAQHGAVIARQLEHAHDLLDLLLRELLLDRVEVGALRRPEGKLGQGARVQLVGLEHLPATR